MTNPAARQTPETDALIIALVVDTGEPVIERAIKSHKALELRLRAALEENDQLKRDLSYAISKMHDETEADRALTRALALD